MGFKRELLPRRTLSGDVLTSALVGIGMRFAAQSDPEANIEDTLLFASEAGMVGDDLRVLAVLATWWGVHSSWVNADRLTRIVEGHEHERVSAFWSAAAWWTQKDRRFSRLLRGYQGHRLDLLAVGTDFQIQRHGEDCRFKGSPLRVPGNALRDRSSDVLSPTELCRRHAAYRHRLIMGPSYRADMWAALEANPQLSAAELARKAYGSFATAWQVKRDFELARGASEFAAASS
jgi:hypothetical protein